MNVNHLPTIVEFVEERIRVIRGHGNDTIDRDLGALNELGLLLNLCEGLNKQQEMRVVLPNEKLTDPRRA